MSKDELKEVWNWWWSKKKDPTPPTDQPPAQTPGWAQEPAPQAPSSRDFLYTNPAWTPFEFGDKWHVNIDHESGGRFQCTYDTEELAQQNAAYFKKIYEESMEREQRREALCWALRSRPLTEDEMQEVHANGYRLFVSCRDRVHKPEDKKADLDAALVQQFKLKAIEKEFQIRAKLITKRMEYDGKSSVDKILADMDGII